MKFEESEKHFIERESSWYAKKAIANQGLSAKKESKVAHLAFVAIKQ
jgi:hypothetical protein